MNGGVLLCCGVKADRWVIVPPYHATYPMHVHTALLQRLVVCYVLGFRAPVWCVQLRATLGLQREPSCYVPIETFHLTKPRAVERRSSSGKQNSSKDCRHMIHRGRVTLGTSRTFGTPSSRA